MSHPPRYDLASLIRLMQLLRDPETGCPWDLKQTPQTIVPFTLEEVHEVIEAIEAEDWSAVEEELGDLLFQVAFYCQLASEQGLFDFSSVIHCLVAKMIRRHPHVFPDGQLERRSLEKPLAEQEIWRRWEQIKAEERAEKKARKPVQGNAKQQVGENNVAPVRPLAERFSQAPKGMGALAYAQKLQKAAAKQGLDWVNVQDVVERLREEMMELNCAIEKHAQSKQTESRQTESRQATALMRQRSALADELGDVLFTCVNVARHLHLDAEQCLRQATQKFCRRAEHVEEQWYEASPGESMTAADPAELDRLWHVAKAATAPAMSQTETQTRDS